MKEIIINSKTYGIYTVLVDDEDFEELNKHKWNLFKCKNTCYSRTKINGKNILMHRFIIPTSKEYQIDHKNSNGLDNQKSNLRKCTQLDNLRNKKANGACIFKGVAFDKERNKFYARITVNRVGKFLGRFYNEKDAALAYNNAAKIIFGEYAKLNIF